MPLRLVGHRHSRAAALAAAAAVSCAALLTGAALSQNSLNHRPPWDSPVAFTQTLHIGGAALQVDFGPGSLDLGSSHVLDWVSHAASAVTTYYGRFPVSRDRILIQPRGDDRGVMQGTTWGSVGGFPAFTRIRLGQHSTTGDLSDDWMLTHELVHTAFPSQNDDQHWIEEGLAVYVEPIARVESGYLQPEQIWSDMVRDMPKGNPQSFDQGLDRTHTWGRTYWGGAQFCLLADVTIREQTHNRKGLQDALRAIVEAGGTIDQDWPVRKAFQTGDAATGTHVLEQQYDRMSTTPVSIDLDALWKKLGILRVEDGMHFDDSAPEAAIRLAITRTPGSVRAAVE